MTKTPPNNIKSLSDRIRNISNDLQEPEGRLQKTMGLVVVGQMLPEGAVKGGSAMALRYGRNTRFTKDLDAARQSTLDNFRNAFEETLEHGWQGFTGRLVEKAPPRPDGVPSGYIMQPFEIKLLYRGKPWQTVDFELGHNETDDAEDPELRIADDITELFEKVGFPAPSPVPVMKVEHQIAQKIHALSTPGSDRVRDLVDLQMLERYEKLDLVSIGKTCQRLFIYRKGHTWPPCIEAGEGWESLYEKAGEELDVLDDVDAAVEWFNSFVQRIDANISKDSQ